MKRVVSFLVWLLFAPLFAILYRNRCYGRDHVQQGGGLIAANHVSFLDPPLIGFCLFPERLCYLARDSLFTSILGWILRNINCYPVKRGRGNASVFKTILDLTGAGKWVVIFPEGTRSPDGTIQRAELGVGLLVQKAKVPVIPCYIEGTRAIWGVGHRIPRLYGRTQVYFGAPIDFSYLDGVDKKVAQQEIVDRIMQEIRQLQQDCRARMSQRVRG